MELLLPSAGRKKSKARHRLRTEMPRSYLITSDLSCLGGNPAFPASDQRLALCAGTLVHSQVGFMGWCRVSDMLVCLGVSLGHVRIAAPRSLIGIQWGRLKWDRRS